MAAGQFASAQSVPPGFGHERGPSGVDFTGIDRARLPGNGFDPYANGAWRATAVIPDDRSSVGVGYDVKLIAERQNAEIVESARQAGADDLNAKRIADYDQAYTDTAGIEARGLGPLKPELDAIAALRDKRQLSALLGASLRADTDPINSTHFSTENLFGLFVTQALEDPSRSVPYLMQGGLGLPDRDYYLSPEPRMAEIRKAYRAYIEHVLTLAGVSDAAPRADRIFALETDIVTAHADIVSSQDAGKVAPWTRADFDTRAPGIDWTAFWGQAGLANRQDFAAWQPEAIAKLSALVAREPLADWQSWLVFHRLNTAAPYLPKMFRDARFELYGKTLQGTPAQRPREKSALDAVNDDLGDAVGRIYATRYFSPEAKAGIETMVKNITVAFDNRIQHLDWMSPKTKAEARRKLKTLVVGVGYSDDWRDDSRLEIRADDPLGNHRRAMLYEYRHQLAKLGRPVDRAEWWMTPQTVNAVNLPLQNALNFPAAILQSPYYDTRFDAAANYGAIGAVIGHEISHSFDNLGADFDADGRLRNWWTPEDLARFEAAGAGLAAQYDGYEALPGLPLKGRQELGENLADVAGLGASLDAYHASLNGQPAPVIDGLTGDQRFFLAFAQSWRTKMRDQALRSRVASDVHAPAMWRIETVRNLDAWYPAFDVKPGEARYLAPEQRVKPWG